MSAMYSFDDIVRPLQSGRDSYYWSKFTKHGGRNQPFSGFHEWIEPLSHAHSYIQIFPVTPRAPTDNTNTIW
jgi:hypothetical protein